MAKSQEGSYSIEQIERFRATFRELGGKSASTLLDVVYLADQLKSERARVFAKEGIGRRLKVLERAVFNILRIYPPGSEELLTPADCDDVAINFHAFAINLYALFDNAVWVCVLEAGAEIAPLKVGPFKTECQAHIPSDLREYLQREATRNWFDTYGKLYRDSTAHRIPPYLPSRAMTPEDGRRWNELDQRAWKLLSGYRPGEPGMSQAERLAAHVALEKEKRSLGRNSELMAISLTGVINSAPPILLHHQLLSDWGLAMEFLPVFTRAMRKQYELGRPRDIGNLLGGPAPF